MSSRIRRLREYLALQEEIARRLNRPIDLDRAALDSEDYSREMIEQDNNSLIPVGPEMIREVAGYLNEPSIADHAMQADYRQNMQEKLQEAQKQGGVTSGPMIASMMQLDR
jgi:hypothetical protein